MHNFFGDQSEHVRLKVHCVLETGNGEQIAQVKTDLLFQDMCSETMVQSAQATLERCVSAQLMGAMRPLILSYISKIMEKQAVTRVESRPVDWAALEQSAENMDSFLASLSRRIAEGRDD